MKTKKKRFLSILLSLALVLGLVPGMSLTAYADSFALEGCNYNTSYNTDGTIKSITVNFEYIDSDGNIGEGTGRESNFLFTTDASKCTYRVGVPQNWLSHDAVWNTVASKNGINNPIWSGSTSSASYTNKQRSDYPAFFGSNATGTCTLVKGSVTIDNTNTFGQLVDGAKYYALLYHLYPINGGGGNNYGGFYTGVYVEVSYHKIAHTVTYKVVNGTWSDDSTGEKKETVANGSNPSNVPTGMKASEGYMGGAWDTNPTGATITEAKTFTYTYTAKADQTAPTGLTATKASSDTATDGKISGVTDAMEYQKDGDTAWTAVGENKTEITGLTSGTYKVRYAGTDDKNASDAATVEVGTKENQTAPTGLTATKASSDTATDGKISGVADTMEYQKDGDTDWTAVGENKTEITGLTSGTYKVRYAGTDDKNASDAATVEVGTKVAPTVTAPTAKNLTYNGQAQELVNAGSTNDGILYYALGTATEATEQYTTSIPAKTDAGTYYVWYYVKGDGTHTDSKPACITVKIAGAVYTATDKEYTITSGEDTPVTVKREPDDSKTYDLYTGAQMDGKALPEGSHTTAKGSLVLTLKAAYLDTLTVGDHKLTIAFQDGSATATVKIKEATPAPTATPKPVPKTGDGSNPALWLGLAVAGLILIAGTVILWDRKKRCGK